MSSENFDISINYTEVEKLQKTMDKLKKDADAVYKNYSTIESAIKDNWQSTEAEYLLKSGNLKNFYENIAIIRDNIKAINEWCTNTMADFKKTTGSNASEISKVMAYK